MSRSAWHRMLAAILVLAAVSARAGEVKLASLFVDHLVLQRDRTVPVWGWADPGETVTVAFAGQTKTARADAQGRWQVQLDPLAASAESRELAVQSPAGTKAVRVQDVVVGDVWLASGQSNMDMALFWTERGKAEAAAANQPLLRYFKVGTVASELPRDMLRGTWSRCVSNGASGCTELGYHFAKELFARLHVPIGIVNSSYGGTAIEAWMEAAALAADPAGPAVLARWQETLAAFPARQAAYEKARAAWTAEKEAATAAGAPFRKPAPFPPNNGPGSQYMPSGLYNAMIHPLEPCALRGILWYQGENNAKRPAEYRTLFPSLIRSWRARFGQGDLPFYWVQLPNYNIGPEADWPGLRAAQQAALALPETGQAVTIDIGEPGNVHPGNKAEVARRLALIALARTYGDATVRDRGPFFRDVEFSAGQARVRFDHADDGLVARDGAPRHFLLAGADRKFVPAAARIEKEAVVLTAAGVAAPVAARYAWAANPAGCNLYNAAGLPAAPFRTDDW